MPGVWKRSPGATVSIVGARPHKRVLRLKSQKVTVTGWVPDVRPYYAAGRVLVAPIFSGMGQQNKIMEAMSMGRPCITTSIVNNAIGATPNEQILLAENAVQFADQIRRVISDDAQAKRLGQSARSFILEQYDWENQNKKLDALLYKHRTAQHV